MNKVLDWILQKEPMIFFVIVILNLYSIFQFGFYYSIDAPQHLYVANIIAELIKGNSEVARFIQINDLIVGYWTGTLILSLLKLLFQASIALKILLSIYFISIAYSFRYLVRSLNKGQTLVTLLIIPFSATFFIGSGYFNFSLGIALMFVCLGYYIRHFDRFYWMSIIVMTLLLILQFLTHAFVFAFTGLLLIIYLLVKFFHSILESSEKRLVLRSFFIKLGKLVLVSIPAIALWINYVVSIQKATSYVKVQYAQASAWIDDIINIKILTWFATEPHVNVNKFILGLLVLLSLYTIIVKAIRIFNKEKTQWKTRVVFFDYGLVMVITSLLLYFFYPDALITSGLTFRFLLLFYLALIIWLSSQQYPKLISILVLIAIIPISFIKWEIRLQHMPELNSKALKVKDISRSMEKNSVYVAVDYRKYWTESHLAEMPGIDKTLIYANAPQIQREYPLMVNKTSCPQIYLGTKNTYTSKLFWGLIGHDTAGVIPADYVLLLNYHDYTGSDDEQIVTGEINKYYFKTDSTSAGYAILYELRNRKEFWEKYRIETKNARGKIKGTDKSLSDFYKEKYVELLNEICLKEE
jgi:hypothetical protein